MNDEFRQSLDITDEDIVPFIPFLLQDLWSLGGNPPAVVDIVGKHISLGRESRIIDLGCGKGATLLALAQAFPGIYKGVDIVDEFISQGVARVDKAGLSQTVHLMAGDIQDAMGDGPVYDLVIYGHDSDILGGPAQTLATLAGLTKTGGHIIYETAYTQNGIHLDGYLSREALFSDIRGSGLSLKGHFPWEDDFLCRLNAENNRFIKQRSDQLKKMHPHLSDLFDDFYATQVKETDILDKYVTCAAFVLQSIL